jgi:uncharacterized protein YciI
MDFDRFTFGLFVRPEEAPSLDERQAAAIQDEHLAYLASLGRAGQLVAAGPLDDQDDVALRGVMIFSTGVDQARSLLSEDPAVRAGALTFKLMSWLTPAGAVSFHAVQFPGSVEEATA